MWVQFRIDARLMPPVVAQPDPSASDNYNPSFELAVLLIVACGSHWFVECNGGL